MNRRTIALGWVGAIAIAAATWRVAATAPFQIDRSRERRAAEHLAGQQLDGAALAIGFSPDPFELRGTWRGELRLPSTATNLRFLADGEVVVARARLGDVELHEVHDPVADWVARPAELRALASAAPLRSGPLELEFRLPLRRRGDGKLWSGRLEELLVVGATPGMAPARVDAAVPFEPNDRGDRLNGGVLRDSYPPLAACAADLADAADARTEPACTFALDEASGQLAIGMRRSTATLGGVLLLSIEGVREPAEPRWFELDVEPNRLAFAAGGAVLVIESAPTDGFVLLELASGTRQRLAGRVEVSPATGLVLEVQSRASGTFVQRLHSMSAPRTVSRRVDGLRRVDFVQGAGTLVRASLDGRAECIDVDGELQALLECARASCRAVVALPFLWCAVVDTAAGTQLQFSERRGREAGEHLAPWLLDLPLHVVSLLPAGDGAELLLFCEAPADRAGPAGASRHQVVRVTARPGERPALIWSGALQPIAASGSNGLLFAKPAGAAPSAGCTLAFASFVALAADREAAPRPIAAAARLDTPPAFGANGRYLYFLHAPDGTLWRHDFLSASAEPLALLTR